MAEDSEDIGGISVNIGASHARLPGDLEAADRLFEQARARWQEPIVLQAQAVRAGRGGAVAGGAGQSEMNALSAKLDRLATSLSAGGARRAQAQAEQVTINGVRVGGLSNLQTSLQKAIGGVAVEANVEPVNQQINELRVQTEKPIELNLDVAGLQTELQGVLTTLKEITAETAKLATTPAAAGAGGRGGGGGRRRPAAVAGPAPEGEEGEGEEQLTGQVNTTRRFGSVFARQRARLAAEAADAPFREASRQAAVRQRAAARPSSRAATPQLNQDDLLRRNRQGQIVLGLGVTDINDPSYRPDTGGGIDNGAPPIGGGGGGGGGGRSRLDRDREAYDQRRRFQTQEAFQRSSRVRQQTVDEDALVRGQARREAAITGSGRTQRTLFSGVAALFGGTERRQIEAQLFSQQAQRQLQSARQVLRPFDELIQDLGHDLTSASANTRQFAQEQIDAIKKSDQYKGAIQNLKKAVVEDADATERLQKISGPQAIARNLLAITTAGLAFGAALKVVDFGLGAIGPALGDAIDKTTGFGATSNKITQALAQQTLAAHGNVNAVLAQAEAQAGLSVAASDALETQIKLTTQVKAGAAAASQAGGLFRAAIGANQQAPQGLLGGFGGIGGGAILGSQLGGGAGFAETIASTFADFSKTIEGVQNQNVPKQVLAGKGFAITTPAGPAPPLTSEQQNRITQIAKDRAAAEASLNDAAKRGATALGLSSDAVIHFGSITAQQTEDIQHLNLPQELRDLAKSGEALYDSNGNLITSYGNAVKGLEQAAVGQGIAPPEQLGRANLFAEQQRQREAAANLPAIQAQQAYERPSQIAAIVRQTQFAIGTQLPAQAALGALANPNVPVGTGIARGDRGSVVGQLKAAQTEQKQLNAYYAQGQDIIENTYKPAIVQNFGAAAGAAFSQALNAVRATGQQIASIQAGISNEQAAYQVAQYNFQLYIAKRNLSDIGGLVGKNLGAGESYLGVLERQNLALSRQAQQLQFALSQRQINFQQALAGFQAPGITPEERQARIKEAQIEAGFAQKQLDIQRKMFGNQVQIVDIGNLRQGADLARQIGLLLQGRRVTIDTAAAEQRLLRLQQLQQQQVARVSTYLSAVDNLAGQAMSQIQQLEAAAGHALEGLAVDILRQYGIVIRGLTSMLNGPAANNPRSLPPGHDVHGATGLLGMTGGPTSMLVGEANGEAVAILRNPRAVNGGMGGGVTNIFNITGNTVRNDSDLDVLVTRVTRQLGREASLKGLRGIG